jgi:hypothetical protein
MDIPAQATWQPPAAHAETLARSDLPASAFAFPTQRKEPLTDARHVRNALVRFNQVAGVTDDDRALAFANIQKAADYYHITLSETSWCDLGSDPRRHR